MNNQRNRTGGRNRLGAKNQGMDRSKKVLLITAAIWVIYIIDELLLAHNPFWFIAIVTVGIWGTGIAIGKPGNFARKVAAKGGFWRALFNRPAKRNRRGRGGRNYRR